MRLIPNVRKVSMSAWVDEEGVRALIGTDYVYSRKPNPAVLATDVFDADDARANLTATREVCRRHGCPLEIILKDISTVRHHPQRLSDWAAIAERVIGR